MSARTAGEVSSDPPWPGLRLQQPGPAEPVPAGLSASFLDAERGPSAWSGDPIRTEKAGATPAHPVLCNCVTKRIPMRRSTERCLLADRPLLVLSAVLGSC